MRIAVFLGSSAGSRPEFVSAAAECGRSLAEAGVGIVYGGASVGLMGVLADAALSAGGEVIGVIPHRVFTAEVAHERLTRLEVVASMHERKARIAQLADAFAALPGGLGTLDELFEILTWRQIGLHTKPIALLEVGGFWDRLVALADFLTDEGFVTEASRGTLLRASDPQELLRVLRAELDSGVRSDG
jgi:uncharacterized protein (TIGR00730 family)